jgi:hypothetical protein
MARQMLTEQKNHYGLGFDLQGSGAGLRFGHGGRDEGFDARLIACTESGQGAAIMINANDNSQMVSRIIEVIAREYHWPAESSSPPPKRASAVVAPDKLAAYTGRYEFANNQMMAFTMERGRLVTVVDGFQDEEFLPESEMSFYLAQRDVQVTFVKDDHGNVTGFRWKEEGHERKAPRIGPLFHSLRSQADPDPARTEKVKVALKALGQGGKALADSPAVTRGAREDFRRGDPARDLLGLKSITFLAENDVSARHIERHEDKVSRILFYRLMTDQAERGLLLHLTADGLVTDFDVVED